MGRPVSSTLQVRVGESHLKNLRKIRECGGWDNDSAAVRFCIDFTRSMLSVLPEMLVENFLAASQEPNGDIAVAGATGVSEVSDPVPHPGPVPDSEGLPEPSPEPSEPAR